MGTRKRMALRSIIVIGGGFTLLFFLIFVRLFWIQYVDAEWLNAAAQSQWEREEFVEPKRGAILDRDGQPLAYNGPSYNVIAILSKKAPVYIQDPIATAKQLAPILNMNTEKLIDLLSRTDRYQVELRPGGWKISEDKKKQIEELEIPGISFVRNTKRYYPNNSFAAHTIGYVDKEGEAKMGLELTYDEILRGEGGKYKFIKDNKNTVLPQGIEDFEPAKDGKDIVLTIDQRIQHFVEQALDESTKSFTAKGLIAVVVDPNTMEILAIASRPQFNPNEYNTSEITNFVNLPISYPYEPGSTMKILTLAAAIEEGVWNPEETYKSGQFSSKAITPPIRDHNQGKGWGEISFLEGIQRSSNVAVTILGYERLGREKLYDFYNRFGMEEKTGIDSPYEKVGKLPNVKSAPPRDIAVTTFGQGFSATAIRQVAAISAAINGGKLLQPFLVKEIRDPLTGEVVESHQPTVLRQVIKESTSKKVREVLETVVDSPNGTGRGYAIEGYRIGGKTGTAQKIVGNKGYSEDKFIYSFVGFAPADKPELLVYIAVDEPNVNVLSSSAVVGKIFKDVMKNSLQYLQVEPETVDQQEIIEIAAKIHMPDLIGKYSNVAEQKALSLGLQTKIIGSGEKVLRQSPSPGASIEMGSSIYLVTEEESSIPDFNGKSLRDVMEFATLMGIQLQSIGTGYVVDQSLPAGSAVQKGAKLVIRLEPRNPLTPVNPADQKPLVNTSESQVPEGNISEEKDNGTTSEEPPPPVQENTAKQEYNYSSIGSTD